MEDFLKELTERYALSDSFREQLAPLVERLFDPAIDISARENLKDLLHDTCKTEQKIRECKAASANPMEAFQNMIALLENIQANFRKLQFMMAPRAKKDAIH